ncbi:Protein CBG04815 [Caenorhabditis briggsae]|uniref:Protein CBG04815 n=1 Tax=Caenorhabditis briggsae TaxID=6238 RepID=A8WYJ3_CAEBR|nr:Protein CBG04815 [Caenorhabditis briggsae]CAP25451.2 Protein CBG04815 [Caenorhabditis briggsae]
MTIEMVLRLNSPVGEIDRIISYLKFGSLDTTVKHGNEESPPIELNFVDVFVEDFKLLSKYQKSYLTNCDVRCSPKTLEIFAKTCEGKMVFEPMISYERELDFPKDPIRLRKVNHGIRECIAFIKPIPHIETYSVSFYRRSGIDLLRTYSELENGEFKDVKYFTDNNEVRISYGNSLPGTDCKGMCLNDIEKTLSYQVRCTKELNICYECIFKRKTGNINEYIEEILEQLREEKSGELDTADLSSRIGDILIRRESPLKTRKFTMGPEGQLKVMEIILAIDPRSLKIIELLYPCNQDSIENKSVEELPFPVDKLSETLQWQNAEQLVSNYLTITTPIQEINVFHVANLEILVKTLSSEDVDYLRTNLLKSSKFQKFKISFREETIDESLYTLIGQPYRTVCDLKKNWYFPFENTNNYIHIVLNTHVESRKGNWITHVRVPIEDTPFF